MARKKVSPLGTRPWRCPICDYAASHGSNFSTQRGLGQHIAMSWDKAHVDWRVEKGILPHKYNTMREVQGMIAQIIPIIKNRKRNLP